MYLFFNEDSKKKVSSDRNGEKHPRKDYMEHTESE